MIVVLPADTEADDAVGLGQAAQDLGVGIFGLVGDPVEHVARDLAYGLDELVLPCIALAQFVHERVEVRRGIALVSLRH